MLRISLAIAIAFAFGSFVSAQVPISQAQRTPSSVLLKTLPKSSVLVTPQKAQSSASISRLAILNARLGRGTADLAVTYLAKGLAGPSHDPRYAYVYGRVKNIGSLAAPGGQMYEFRQNGIVLKRGTMPAVAAGQEITVSHNFPGLNMPSGPVTLQIFSRDNLANNSRTILP